MAEVPRTRTAQSEQQIVAALPAAFAAAGAQLNRDAARLLLGQIYLETGRGQNLFNNNWGNLAAGPTWKGDIWRPPWYLQSDIDALPTETAEQRARKAELQNRHDRMSKDVPSAFRAYPTAQAGLLAYADLLTGKRYVPLLNAAFGGSPARFAEQIKATGYTPTLDVPAHTKTFERLYSEAVKAGHFSELAELPRVWEGLGLGTKTAVVATGAGALVALPLFFSLSRVAVGGAEGYVPLGFVPNEARSLFVARLVGPPFRMRELQAIRALPASRVLDVTVDRGGKLYTCLPYGAVPAMAFHDAARFEPGRFEPEDVISIQVEGTVSDFIAWGEVLQK